MFSALTEFDHNWCSLYLNLLGNLPLGMYSHINCDFHPTQSSVNINNNTVPIYAINLVIGITLVTKGVLPVMPLLWLNLMDSVVCPCDRSSEGVE